MIQITAMTADQLHAVAVFTARLQADHSHHISYFDLDAADIEAYINDLEPNGLDGFLLAHDENKLVGLIGIESDPELSRAWIHGPLVDHPDWDTVAGALYDAALRHENLIGIDDYELAGDTANTRLHNFALRHGYDAGIGNAVLVITADKLENLPAADMPAMNAAHQEAFIRLHDTTFPGTYYSGKQIVEMIDDEHQVFVAADGHAVLGYILVKRNSASEGYIDFLGVDESARRQGLGRGLIATGTRWLFTLPGIEQVALTVRDDNAGAIALYQQVGFTMERAIRGYRKKQS